MGSIPLLAYIPININPIIFYIGPLALRWYGLMYVVGILVGLRVILNFTKRKGIDQDIVYRVLWWCIVAGLLGGRLYSVVQQPNFVSFYLAHPEHILATWEGGMAFFGAIFLTVPVLFWRARVERINPLIALDGGALFATAGQLFGRVGNIINGDIIGYRSNLPWSTVYQNPNSFACLNPATCNVPVHPFAAYEMLIDIALLALLIYLSYRLRRPGLLMVIYLYAYAITQFLLNFVRDLYTVTFLGLDWGFKQVQWTSLVVFIALIPITYLIFRYSKPVPAGEIPATYGIPQKEKARDKGGEKLETITLDTKTKEEEPIAEEVPKEEEPIAEEVQKAGES